jgi:hypothetical protein
LHEEFKDQGFSVLAVNGYDETRERVQQFVDSRKLTHPIVLMGGKIARERYHVIGYPTSFWLDREGKVLGHDSGYAASQEVQLRNRIVELLKK